MKKKRLPWEDAEAGRYPFTRLPKDWNDEDEEEEYDEEVDDETW